MKTKLEAKYVDASPYPAKRCGNCSMYRPRSCTLVKGLIKPAGWCRYWEKKK